MSYVRTHVLYLCGIVLCVFACSTVFVCVKLLYVFTVLKHTNLRECVCVCVCVCVCMSMCVCAINYNFSNNLLNNNCVYSFVDVGETISLIILFILALMSLAVLCHYCFRAHKDINSDRSIINHVSRHQQRACHSGIISNLYM